jgi:hypothetical protein
MPEGEWENLIQNPDMSFMSIGTRGNIIPKTPEAGYMVAQAFILASKPLPVDPRESLYQMAMTCVGVMGATLAGGRHHRNTKVLHEEIVQGKIVLGEQ